MAFNRDSWDLYKKHFFSIKGMSDSISPLGFDDMKFPITSLIESATEGIDPYTKKPFLSDPTLLPEAGVDPRSTSRAGKFLRDKLGVSGMGADRAGQMIGGSNPITSIGSFLINGHTGLANASEEPWKVTLSKMSTMHKFSTGRDERITERIKKTNTAYSIKVHEALLEERYAVADGTRTLEQVLERIGKSTAMHEIERAELAARFSKWVAQDMKVEALMDSIPEDEQASIRAALPTTHNLRQISMASDERLKAELIVDIEENLEPEHKKYFVLLREAYGLYDGNVAAYAEQIRAERAKIYSSEEKETGVKSMFDKFISGLNLTD
jgi:hypothetical protein